MEHEYCLKVTHINPDNQEGCSLAFKVGFECWRGFVQL
jgi:hypothetical protein